MLPRRQPRNKIISRSNSTSTGSWTVRRVIILVGYTNDETTETEQNIMRSIRTPYKHGYNQEGSTYLLSCIIRIWTMPVIGLISPVTQCEQNLFWLQIFDRDRLGVKWKNLLDFESSIICFALNVIWPSGVPVVWRKWCQKGSRTNKREHIGFFGNTFPIKPNRDAMLSGISTYTSVGKLTKRWPKQRRPTQAKTQGGDVVVHLWKIKKTLFDYMHLGTETNKHAISISI